MSRAHLRNSGSGRHPRAPTQHQMGMLPGSRSQALAEQQHLMVLFICSVESLNTWVVPDEVVILQIQRWVRQGSFLRHIQKQEAAKLSL